MNNFQYIDIFILAAIAGYLIFKLSQVLGKPKGRMPSHNKNDENVIPISNDIVPQRQHLIPRKFSQTAKKFSQIDKSFDIKDFLVGAEKAFEIILQAFYAKDKASLKSLMGDEIYQRFEQIIDEANKGKEINESKLLCVKDVSLEEMKLRKTKGSITVKIISEQVYAIFDENGDLIAGDPNQVETITDIWVFTRDLSSENPNWMLVEAVSE